MRRGVFDAGGKVAAAAAVAVLALAPTLAIAAGAPKPKAIALSFEQISTFTPAGADPRLAASFAGRPRSITDFRFTPAAAKGRPSQIRVAVRARSGGLATPPALAGLTSPAAMLTPTSYNLGVAVGWKRFAVGGDVSAIKDPDPAIGKRESAVVGVSYNLKKFTGRVAVGSERSDGRIAALAQPDRYSVDVGGAYNLSRRVAVTGGVRYRIDQDKLNVADDQRRDSQAVYVGTAFKF